MLAQALSTAVVGSPETVKQGIDAFVRRTGADELMVTAQIFDHAARVRSFEILADVSRELAKAAEGSVARRSVLFAATRTSTDTAFAVKK